MQPACGGHAAVTLEMITLIYSEHYVYEYEYYSVQDRNRIFQLTLF